MASSFYDLAKKQTMKTNSDGSDKIELELELGFYTSGP